ncbi:MAG: septation regulator SpoVG [Candidatus Borkfalkiaceae bacterium]|nr:septation regulator SpoVG [Christensenellaceae bacterium]
MNITDLRVRLISKSDGKLKAVASITIDNAFVVHDIKIIEGNDGLFVAMPSRKTADGDYKDVAHPINTEVREALIKKVLAAYNEELSKAQQ